MSHEMRGRQPRPIGQLADRLLLSAGHTLRSSWQRPTMGRPLGLRGPLRALAEIAGGRSNLAKLLGVSTQLINYWSRGEAIPSQKRRIQLAEMARAHGLEPPYATTKFCPRPDWLEPRKSCLPSDIRERLGERAVYLTAPVPHPWRGG